MEEDLKIKIGTPEEAFWTSVMKKCDEMIEQSKHEIVIQEEILKLSQKKLEEEKNRNI